MGSEQQDARKEIISLKEQLASTSQVSLGENSSLFCYPRISFLFSKIRFYLQLDLKNLLRAVFNWLSKSKTKVISVTNRSVEMEHLFHVDLRSTIYFIDCYYRYVSQSLKEKTDQMESANKQYVLEKVSLNMFYSIFAPLLTCDFVAQLVVAPY